jgi:hypothetical protein
MYDALQELFQLSLALQERDLVLHRASKNIENIVKIF